MITQVLLLTTLLLTPSDVAIMYFQLYEVWAASTFRDPHGSNIRLEAL